VGAPDTDSFLAQLQDTGKVEVVHTGEVSFGPEPRRGAAAPPEPLTAGAVVVEAETAPDELHVLMVRHASGAITFHFAADVAQPAGRRGTRQSATKTIRFSVPVTPEATAEEGTRRGFVTSILKTALLKITGKLADLAMPALSKLWEKAAWGARAQGWKLATQSALQSGELPVLKDFSKVSHDPSKPNLLLIHGTFSNALDAYKHIADTKGSNGRTLLDSVADLYEDRIFAFDHFSVSKTPRQNAQDLLDALPDGSYVFDVVTHSRGGLVLRHLTELGKDFGPAASKVKVRRVALVASPNEGTPLATPARFDTFVSWISNILDLFPDNPFTDGIAFVSDAIGWLAHRVGGSIPGLAAMDGHGQEITALENSARPAGVEYSALVSNYLPEQNLLKRMADVGVSVFFGSANDLVVPSAGGWKTTSPVPVSRIACYGNGGNLAQPAGSPVSHVSFFNRPATIDFLRHALRGESQGLNAVDPAKPLPFLLRRAALAAPVSELPLPAPAPPPASVPPPAPSVAAPFTRSTFTNETFYLSVVDVQQVETGKRSSTPPEWAILIATFRNARVVEKMSLKHGEAGERFRQIIGTAISIRNYIDGSPKTTELPHGDRLVALGTTLFETLFPGDIRRLYDVARAEQINQRINLIFTSQVSWLADLPLEFVYDPARKSFLATSEVNFTRNVVTAVPADLLPLYARALRILVVVAQPLGLAHLSVAEEEEVIVSGFQTLIDAGLVTVEVLSDATPMLLHRNLENNEYDILHFIGHGEYDRANDIGCLVFETESGGMQRVDSAVLQQIVCRRKIRLVFLNACETGTGGRAEFNSGVAPALVQAGVPAVIGNQYSVLDVSATAFARHLYWSLGQGHSIGDAAREARVAVNYLITGEAIDWAVPVVFARDPAEKLCERRGEPKTLLEHKAEEQRAIRRSGNGKRLRVALWDVQRVIPNLDEIARRLTEVQDRFTFEAVAIPAPLGTWRRVATGDTAYLKAEQVVKRIADKPAELGVDKLFAFTNLPMADATTTDLYAWDEDPDEKISLFSFHAFLDQLDPPRLTIERMVANAVAGFLASIADGAHDIGPKNCPMFYNPDREVQWVAGPLHFCKPDEKRIGPAIREAVKALLRVYA
jgi:hypothetical protein